MKQNKLKTLVLVLALALVLTLAVGMLAACDPKDKNGESRELEKLVSADQFNAFMAYTYSVDLGKDGEANAGLYYYSAAALKEGSPLGTDFETKGGMAQASISVSTGEYDEETWSYSDERQVKLYFLNSAEEATKAKDVLRKEQTENMTVSTVGNTIVLESEKGLYEQILKATFPKTVSAARKQAIAQSYNLLANSNSGYASVGVYVQTEDQKTTTYEEMYANIYPYHGNCDEGLAYASADEESIKEEKEYWEEGKKFYTDDSYFDTTRETGYVFQYYKYKPGFSYEEIESGENKGKLRINAYYYNEDTIESLTVPAKIDGKEVKEASFYGNLEAKSITLEEGIESLDLNSSQLTSLTLPSTLESLSLSAEKIETLNVPGTVAYMNLRCPSLKTIKYDGNKAEFEATFSEYTVQSWYHIMVDYGEDGPVYKDITIKVICKDAELTYPEKTEEEE